MKFTFSSPEANFECQMVSSRCESATKHGTRCGRHACIGTRYCWTHLLRDKKLRVKKSDTAGAGKGLFAMDIDKTDNQRVFAVSDFIIEYDGDVLNQSEIDRRYGEHTAPYAIGLSRRSKKIEDAACRRGFGALINHSHSPNCEFQLMRNNRVSVVAIKSIKNNTELLADYGTAYRLDDNASHRTR